MHAQRRDWYKDLLESRRIECRHSTNTFGDETELSNKMMHDTSPFHHCPYALAVAVGAISRLCRQLGKLYITEKRG